MVDVNALPERISKLNIRYAGITAGRLTHGSIYSFQPESIEIPISLTMQQKSLDPVTSGALHPIFSQNLPEGFNRRFIEQKLARYAKVNDMYLLALQAEHGVGLLSFDAGLQLQSTDGFTLNDILTYNAKESLFPQLLERYYLRNSLSGVQPKVSITNPPNQTGRSLLQERFIVKTFDDEFPLLTVNEYVCMQAAKNCELNPPAIYLSENLEHFVIERFDFDKNGYRLGYEDFTVLMKKSNDSHSKYSGSYENLLKATGVFTNQSSEVTKMFRYIVFNCLIGNGDAHLKNFALQYNADMKNIFVSPPYDITHSLVYETIDKRLALKINGSKDFPVQNDLLKLASTSLFEIRKPRQIIEQIAQGILDYINRSAHVNEFPGLKESIQRHVSKTMISTGLNKSFRHNKKRKHS